MIKQLVHDKIDEIFLELQEANGIIDGGISPIDAMHLDQLEDNLARIIGKVIAYQPKEVSIWDLAPSWYIYTDSEGTFHNVTYGQIDMDKFFFEISHRIAFDDCSGETVHKIYYKGKEINYVGWQPSMKFEYKDLDGNTVWLGVFTHWDH